VEWATIISEIFTVVLIPLLGIVTKYFIQFINIKAAELKQKKEDALYQKYIDMLNTTIVNAVTTTTQTYVNSLKSQGKFDAEAQAEAFNKTYQSVISVLGEEAQTYLSSAIGDLNEYIRTAIERQVLVDKLIPSTTNG